MILNIDGVHDDLNEVFSQLFVAVHLVLLGKIYNEYTNEYIKKYTMNEETGYGNRPFVR